MKANAPEKIYLQVCGDCQDNECDNCKFEDLEDNVTWCKDKIFKKDIEYIRADAFIEKVANYLNYVLYDRVEIRKPGTLIPSLCTKGEVIEDFKTYMEDKI